MRGLRTAEAVKACCEPAIIFRPRLWRPKYGPGMDPTNAPSVEEIYGGHGYEPSVDETYIGHDGEDRVP